MKNLNRTGLILSFMLMSIFCFSQDHVPLNEPDYNKPKLFNALPEKIAVDMAELKRIFNSNFAPGQEIAIRAKDAHLPEGVKGKIVATSALLDNRVKTMSIRPAGFEEASFTLSSSVLEDGSVIYAGAIISKNHIDAFELEKQGTVYYLVKKNYYQLINE